MADYEVSKIMWVAIVVALAASIFIIAKPQINTLAHSTFDKISSVTSGIRVSDIKHTAYANNAEGTDGFSTTKPNLNLLDGTKDFKPGTAGNATPNQNAGHIWFAQAKSVADLFKAGDNITISYDIEFLNTELYNDWSDDVFIQIQMFGGNWEGLSRVKAKNMNGRFYTMDTSNSSDYIENPTHKVKVSRTIQLTQDFINANATVNNVHLLYNNIPVGANTKITNLKIEPGSTVTPYMPSSSEVKPSDQPKYIGTYTDKSDLASQDPKKYTWKLNPDYHE